MKWKVHFISCRVLHLKVYFVFVVYTAKWETSFLSFIFFFHLFVLVGGQSLYNIAVGFVIHWHESAMDLCVFPILIPPPTSVSTQSLWVFPVHQARALVSCIQPGLVICFTIDNIHEKPAFFLLLLAWCISHTAPPAFSSIITFNLSVFL